MRKPNYDKFPYVAVPGGEDACVQGWDAIAGRLQQAVAKQNTHVLVVECYAGVDESQVLAELVSRLKPALAVDVRSALLPPAQVDKLVEPFLGGNDPVFGFLSGLGLPEFFDVQKVAALREQVATESGLVLIVGCGARLVADGDILVYADLARWEAQLRFRRHHAGNLAADNKTSARSLWTGACATDGSVRSSRSGISFSTPTIQRSRSSPTARRCAAACATR